MSLWNKSGFYAQRGFVQGPPVGRFGCLELCRYDISATFWISDLEFEWTRLTGSSENKLIRNFGKIHQEDPSIFISEIWKFVSTLIWQRVLYCLPVSDEEILLTGGNKESQCQNVNVTPLSLSPLLSSFLPTRYTAGLRWVDNTNKSCDVIWCDVMCDLVLVSRLLIVWTESWGPAHQAEAPALY